MQIESKMHVYSIVFIICYYVLCQQSGTCDRATHNLLNGNVSKLEFTFS